MFGKQCIKLFHPEFDWHFISQLFGSLFALFAKLFGIWLTNFWFLCWRWLILSNRFRFSCFLLNKPLIIKLVIKIKKKYVTSTTVGSGWGGGSSFRSGPLSINPATSPRCRNSSGISHSESLAEGLKKKCLPSPVQTMHQGVPGTALLPTKNYLH